MKKVFLLTLSIIFILTSCRKEYEKTLENYLEYLKKNNYKKAYDLLSSRDKSTVSYEDFASNNEESAISKNISKSIKYRIIDSSLSETKKIVKIKVQISKIDLKKAFFMLPQLLNKGLSGEEIDKIFKKNKKQLRTCYEDKDIVYRLVLENRNWKIDADYERKKRISFLLNEADRYLINNQYKEALSRYEDVLDLEYKNHEALSNIVKIKEKMSYIKNFIKFNYEYKILKNDGNGAIISLQINNNGTIVVKKIFVDFVFYDKNGNTIFKERKEVINNPDKKIGYKENIRRVINLEVVGEFYKCECIISAIDF